jgi:galacturan 1,4-alpha-galacturonidase
MMFLLLIFSLLLSRALGEVVVNGTRCTVSPLSATPIPAGAKSADDAPQILSAFKSCGKNGSIEIMPGDYYIGRVMDTLDFQNVEISIRGKWTWSTDIQYWLRNSISVTYAQRSTAWRLGGTNITLNGHGEALWFGNGQMWYDQNRNQGNQNGRPIVLTLWRANNVLINGITWRQPMFWYVIPCIDVTHISL